MFYADSENIARTLLKKTLDMFIKERSKRFTDFTQIIYKTPSKNQSAVALFYSLVGGKVTHKEAFVTQFTHQILNVRHFDIVY